MKEIEKKGTQSHCFHCDWTLVLGGPARPVRRGREDASVGDAPDAGSLGDRTLKGCIRSSGRSAQCLGLSTGRWAVSGQDDRTRPVDKNRFWTLTGNDRTLRVSASCQLTGASYRSRQMTVGVRHVADYERPDAGGSASGQLTGASDQSALCPVKGYNGYISWGLLFKPHGRL